MVDKRQWTVKSNSFGLDYKIEGATLAEAISAGLHRIAQGTFPGRSGRYRVVSAAAEWMPGILRGRGGVELSIQAIPPGQTEARAFVSWIEAPPLDMPERRIIPVPARASA